MKLGLDIETTIKWDLRTLQFYNPEKDRVSVFWTTGQKPRQFQHFFVSGPTFDKVERTGNVVGEEQIKKILLDNEFVTHSGYFDHYICLKELGINPTIAGDSFILSSLVPSPLSTSRSLNNQMQKMVNPEYDKFKYGAWEDFSFEGPDLSDQAILYAANDAVAGYRLEEKLVAEYPQYAGTIYKVECELISVLSKMRHLGMSIDKATFKEALDITRLQFQAMQDEINKIAGHPVRLGSVKELRELLFGKLGLEAVIKTPKGEASTSMEALEYLTHPIAEAIKEAKHTSSVLSALESIDKSEFIEDLGETLRAHPEFKALSSRGTYGGRIYTKDPAVNSWNWTIRGAVIPQAPNCLYYYADLVAAEFILIAWMAGEMKVYQAYLDGEDIHRVVGSEIFQVKPEDVTEEMRDITKVVEYATIYGSEGHSVARALRCSLEKAQEYQAKFMARFPGIKTLRESLGIKANKSGIAKTPFGRARRLEGFPAQTSAMQAKLVRTSFNFYAQSGVADLMKMASKRIDSKIPAPWALNFEVFDSFLVAVDTPEAQNVLDEILINALTFKLPKGIFQFRIKSGIGRTWREAKENAK